MIIILIEIVTHYVIVFQKNLFTLCIFFYAITVNVIIIIYCRRMLSINLYITFSRLLINNIITSSMPDSLRIHAFECYPALLLILRFKAHAVRSGTTKVFAIFESKSLHKLFNKWDALDTWALSVLINAPSIVLDFTHTVIIITFFNLCFYVYRLFFTFSGVGYDQENN